MKKISLFIFALICSFSTMALDEPSPIQVEVIGKGQPLVLIPGFTVPGEVWYPLVEELQDRYECHIVTLAGFGGMEPIDFPWLPKVNEAIRQYILEKDLQNTVVIGHSLGGTVATWLASRESPILSKIILIDALPASGALMFPDFNPDNLAYESPFNTQQINMSSEEFKQMAQMMAQGMSLIKEGQEKIKNWIVASDRKTYVYGYTDYLKLDLREDLEKITIPVFLMAASQPYGEAMARQTYQDQYENLKDYELIMAENSAHFIMFDQPEWFLEQVKLILSSEK